MMGATEVTTEQILRERIFELEVTVTRIQGQRDALQSINQQLSEQVDELKSVIEGWKDLCGVASKTLAEAIEITKGDEQ